MPRSPREILSQSVIQDPNFVGSHFQNYLGDLRQSKVSSIANNPEEQRRAAQRMELNAKLMRAYNTSLGQQNSQRTKDVSFFSQRGNQSELLQEVQTSNNPNRHLNQSVDLERRVSPRSFFHRRKNMSKVIRSIDAPHSTTNQ